MNTRLPKLLLAGLTAIFLSSTDLHSQVVINEICPSNISIIQNSNGKYDDFIELYNAGGSSVNLNGYGLTDNLSNPYAFRFPSHTLGAGQRILVFASDSTSEVIVHHYEMPVNGTSSWKYRAGSAALDTTWRNLSFNDGSWASGNGGIGFSDGARATGACV